MSKPKSKKSGRRTNVRRRGGDGGGGGGGNGHSYGSSSWASRARTIKIVLLFLPGSVVLLKRIWIPFEGGGQINKYLDVDHVAISQRIKDQQREEIQQPSDVWSSTISSGILPPYYSLQRITSFDRMGKSFCWGNNKHWIQNTHHYLDNDIHFDVVGRNNGSTKIPKYVHVHVSDRCVSDGVKEDYEQWNKYMGATSATTSTTTTVTATATTNTNTTTDNTWSMFVHDENALYRLLSVESVQGHFPALRSVLQSCFLEDDNALIAVWKLLVLYTYGGVYVKLGTKPVTRDGTDNTDNNNVRLFSHLADFFHSDGQIGIVLFTDSTPSSPSSTSSSGTTTTTTETQNVNQEDHQEEESRNSLKPTSRILTNIMASSPRHPFLFLTIHYLILDLMYNDPSTIITNDKETGDNNNNNNDINMDEDPYERMISNALRKAWIHYDENGDGTSETTIRFLKYDDYVTSNSLDDHRKRRFAGTVRSKLRHMGNDKVSTDRTTCLQNIFTVTTTGGAV